MIGFCPLASGSKGNSLYLGTKTTKLLIDAGLSAKVTKERLAEIGVKLEEIDAIMISHEHTDHISGIPMLAGKMGIPLFTNRDTAEAIVSLFDIQPKFKIFSTGEAFEYGDIEILPFNVQHDAIDPVGFTIRMQGVKIGICTDLGIVTSSIVKHLKGCDYLYVEANHEPSMVHASSRPQVYKDRVLSRQGHLSNAECAYLLTQVMHPGLKHVYLAHLSQECNTPEKALAVMKEKLSVELSIAYQEKRSHAVLF